MSDSPVGTISVFPEWFTENDMWAIPDGRVFSKEENPELYAVLGCESLPDMRNNKTPTWEHSWNGCADKKFNEDSPNFMIKMK